MKKFIINHYDVKSVKIGKSWDKTKIVMLSDLHDNSYGIDLDEVYRNILMIHPDYIMIAGDMYNGEPGCANKNAEQFLTKLAGKFPVYYGLGNHEYRLMIHPDRYEGMYAEFMAMIRKTGIHLLKNESMEVKRQNSSIIVSGLMLDYTF
ncbi:MAG: metallophosphoesterase, partial [Thermoflexaceae bacterium]|nr:metallophosphoesterase [Thermoflexaceae bacterium]